ncbi:DUF4383 domain-containing protein [Candidatus Peregrinibacteria bacterium]|nr:DUF4383 domain-containing protein [Candidatus Peregrinibacteria bacterium]MBI4129479.1 DUF4383 domain-containing protein [Candidatus Peregrinibacteria bacterium]
MPPSRHGVFDAEIQPLTKVLGVVLTILGVAGFLSDGMLFLFAVDFSHNLIHLLSGLAALYAARSHHLSQWYLMVFGAVYFIVALAGFLWDGDILGFFWTNRADDYLHAIIAITALVVSFSGRISSAKRR